MDFNFPVMSPLLFESLHARREAGTSLKNIYIKMVNIDTPLSDLCILYVQEPEMFTLHGAILKCEEIKLLSVVYWGFSDYKCQRRAADMANSVLRLLHSNQPEWVGILNFQLTVMLNSWLGYWFADTSLGRVGICHLPGHHQILLFLLRALQVKRKKLRNCSARWSITLHRFTADK